MEEEWKVRIKENPTLKTYLETGGPVDYYDFTTQIITETEGAIVPSSFTSISDMYLFVALRQNYIAELCAAAGVPIDVEDDEDEE